ncbi:MAG TPA: histidine phosphotransferase family protein [Caulobacteraceae bacterium]|jgi:histidine phosphotransferase ChpT|nr:histidine phosphotransferase family protein [Caulobacteraceae bacterium]
MTDASFHADHPASAAVPAEDLAAKLAARLCHDFMSPASGIVSGLDLLEDPSAKDMQAEAMALIASSARKLVDQLTFARVAFGAYASAEVFDSRELEGLAQGVFAHVRPSLEWAVEPPQLTKPAARALLNLVQLAAGALAVGGSARASVTIEDGLARVSVEAAGPRARLHAEVLDGLEGRSLGEGLSGRWVQAYYLHSLVKAAGGSVSVESGEDRVAFRAVVPA